MLSLIVLSFLKVVGDRYADIRTAVEEEIEGLDLSEHGMSAYDITPEQ
ncbi:MAG TPA: hypothetical protein V6D48_07270 [Oculatellaceae cyanobacterium]